MYVNLEPFGISVYGEIVGSTWLSLVEAILKNGEMTSDEGRNRLSLQNVRIKAVSQVVSDPLVKQYADPENIKKIIDLSFENDVMYDFDVVPSFSKGSKSYAARVKEGKMFDYVVERLALIPESKKAVMSFIHWNDYEAVLRNPKDDYLPCITTLQFRLLNMEKTKGYYMNTVFNARSIDAFQKAPGNFTVMTLMANKVAQKLEEKLKTPIVVGSLDGFITDAHIYQETLQEAEKTIKKYKKYENNSINQQSRPDQI